jgi:hypothetical protein
MIAKALGQKIFRWIAFKIWIWLEPKWGSLIPIGQVYCEA